MSILGGSGGSGGIRVLMTAGLIPSLSSGVGAGVPDKHEPSVTWPYGGIGHFSRIGDFRTAQEGAVVGSLFTSPKEQEAKQQGPDIVGIIFHCRCFKSLLADDTGYRDDLISDPPRTSIPRC